MNLTSQELNNYEEILEYLINFKTIPSLESILDEKIRYQVNKLSDIKTNQSKINQTIKNLQNINGVYLKCEGDFHIGILVYFTQNTSKLLIKKLLSHRSYKKLNQIKTSSILEIGNILSVSIFNALSINKNCRLNISIPGYALESLQIMLDSIVNNFECDIDELLFVNFSFQGSKSNIKFDMLVIQDSHDLKKLFA